MKLFVATKALVLREGKMLILREADTYVDGGNVGKWDVPGGRIEVDEPFLQGLAREVKEESGLAIENSQIISVQETFPTIRGEECHIIRMYFSADALAGEVVLSEDHDAFLWVDPKEHRAHHLMEDLHEVCEDYARRTTH